MFPKKPHVTVRKTNSIDRYEFRAVVKLLSKQGKKPDAIVSVMSMVYGDYGPKKDQIIQWQDAFKREEQQDQDRLQLLQRKIPKPCVSKSYSLWFNYI